jgi:hypothetical protein
MSSKSGGKAAEKAAEKLQSEDDLSSKYKLLQQLKVAVTRFWQSVII